MRTIMAAFTAIAAATAVTPSAASPSSPVADPGFPRLTGPVVDTAHEIPADQAAELSRELRAFQARTGHQMVVVTIPDLHGVAKEDYAYRLGRAWGIGRKGVDDGIVLLQSPGDGKPGSGRLRIDVGYGLEGVLTDAEAAAVTHDVMVPILRSGRPMAQAVPVAIEACAREGAS